MVGHICRALPILSYLTNPELYDSDYTYVEDLMLKYKEVEPSKYMFDFKASSQKTISQRDLTVHTAVLAILLFVRIATLFVKNGVRFNATKKVYYIKKVLAIAWMRYLKLLLDYQTENDIVWYVLMAAGIFECMNLFDMFKRTQIPFMSTSKEIVQVENGIERYSDEEHEFIDNFNFFDFVTLVLNTLFLVFTINALLYKNPKELYYDEWSLNFSFEI